MASLVTHGIRIDAARAKLVEGVDVYEAAASHSTWHTEEMITEFAGSCAKVFFSGPKAYTPDYRGYFFKKIAESEDSLFDMSKQTLYLLQAKDKSCRFGICSRRRALE